MLPVTVMVRGEAPPTGSVDGRSRMDPTVGSLTLMLAANVVPPPGPGFVTATDKTAAVVRSVAVNGNVS